MTRIDDTPATTYTVRGATVHHSDVIAKLAETARGDGWQGSNAELPGFYKAHYHGIDLDRQIAQRARFLDFIGQRDGLPASDDAKALRQVVAQIDGF